MISNQILQNTLDGLKGISRSDFCVTDMEGKVLATTFSGSVCGQEEVSAFANSQADSQVVKGNQYFKIYDDHQLEYVLVVSSAGDDVYTLGKLVVFQIQGLLTAYKERFNKDNFIKNLLLDNLLLVDIHNRAKKLHIEVDVRRVVYILESSQDKDYGSLENIKNLLGGKPGDFVTAVDEKNIIIVKELAPSDGYPQLEKTANNILAALGVEKDGTTHIAYGTIVKELKEVSRSYKEAKMALDVGKIFFGERDVIAYSSLGIGRLIYQLPIPLCKMFIREIFDTHSPDDFDEETLTTINKFFENSLNVSETSRQLYIHRNTLVYRLDKLQKSTGLDLRVFEDAITFKIALMVVKYMKYMETLDYYGTEKQEVIMIDLKNVSKSYSKGQPAIDNMTLHVDKGEFVFIVGNSGSGKSTLIKLLLKELDPTSGTITVNGQVLNKLKRRKVAKYRRGIGVVFQDFRLLKDRNVYENVAFAQRVIQRPTRIIKKRVPEMLTLVGLAEKYKSKPDQLSGGEQQRVALARALVNRPSILLADEPTGNLDPKNSFEIMKLLEEINERGTTVLVVTHNREIVNAFKKRVITMKKGVIVSDEQEGEYLNEN